MIYSKRNFLYSCFALRSRTSLVIIINIRAVNSCYLIILLINRSTLSIINRDIWKRCM